MPKRTLVILSLIGLILCIGPVSTPAEDAAKGLTIENGWFVAGGRVVWGYGQHNGWWRPGQRPNLARNAPGQIGPNRTEDLDKLTDAMLRFGYPGFEHNFGLWYDRRRDAHDTARRGDARAVPPFLEQPWARSGTGTAWDGLSRYDLTRYNAWYFRRLKEFADLCDRKGTILFHNHYMQHALLETDAHYVDFPWRPGNCIQHTGLPQHTPAANAFYDISNPERRKLHRAYIRKCLDELGGNSNVVFLCSEEYTGPLAFMEFWLDTVFAWEKETGRDVHVGLGGCKNVIDAVLADPARRSKISTIDLRYWWYRPDGTLFAPEGGRQVAGRFIVQAEKTSPEQLHRQIEEYRRKYPHKAILHGVIGTRQHAWAALSAGGSMLIGQMPYPHLSDPAEYISPEKCLPLQPSYDFIRQHLSTTLPRTAPADLVLDHPQRNWCLADPGRTYLVYALEGGSFRLDLSAAPGSFRATWFDPRSGKLQSAGHVEGGRPVAFTAPDEQDWALWLSRVAADPQPKQTARFAKWSPIELAFRGPVSKSLGTPNPFAVRLDAVFTSPGGRAYRVPGFYDGDGAGSPDGNVWKVRFSADACGPWTWRSSSSHKLLDARSGSFTVGPVSTAAGGFWKWGRLEYVGTPKNTIRYLKFRDGPYWLKAGCDDPENFLGSFHNYNTDAKRRAAIDYLARRAINSLYLITHNIDGDGNDVWPWLGATASQAKANGGRNARFDVARLQRWRKLFEWMQSQGVVPYLILEDDSAWSGYDHRRYYREMVARFGDLPALLFNVGEENNENYTLADGLALARQLEEVDPFGHPCGIHNVNRPNDAYIDAAEVDFTSIQTGSPGTRLGREDALRHNQIAIDWIARCRARGRRVLVVNFDEGRPEQDRRAWWSAYLGGGVWEAHVLPPYDCPLAAWEPLWTQLGGTRAFIESLPFWEMQPHNELVTSGRAFCLAKPPQVYALYLPQGGSVAVELGSPATSYDCGWWDPANGPNGTLRHQQRTSGGKQTFTAPAKGDWALRIVRREA